MEEAIELAFESPGGIIDCRLEPVRDDDELYYSVTILYPAMVNGYNRSEIYCHTLRGDRAGGYFFEDGDDMLPKVRALEGLITKAMAAL